MKTTTIKIDGMHCEGCAQTLQFLLGREAGVRKVEVSFAEREARILHDPQASDSAKLAAIIGKAGFRVARPADLGAHVVRVRDRLTP